MSVVAAEATCAGYRTHWDVQASFPAAAGQQHMLQGARSEGGAAAADSRSGRPQAAAAPQRPPLAAVSAAALEELKQLQVLHRIAHPGTYHDTQNHRLAASVCKACSSPAECGSFRVQRPLCIIGRLLAGVALLMHSSVLMSSPPSSLLDLLPDLCPCPAACSRSAAAGGTAAAAAGGGAAQALGPRRDVRRAAGGPGRAAGQC